MDGFGVMVIGGSGLLLWLASALPYAVLLALVNWMYRASNGRFFPWFSKRTVLPFLCLLPVCLAVSWALWSTYPGPK